MMELSGDEGATGNAPRTSAPRLYFALPAGKIARLVATIRELGVLTVRGCPARCVRGWPRQRTNAPIFLRRARHSRRTYPAQARGDPRSRRGWIQPADGRRRGGTLAALRSYREQLIEPEVAAHSGRIVKLMGDGALVEFASVVDAVACAVEIQQHDGGAQRRSCRRTPHRFPHRHQCRRHHHRRRRHLRRRRQRRGAAGSAGRTRRHLHFEVGARAGAATRSESASPTSASSTLKNIARPVRVYCVMLRRPASRPASRPTSAAPLAQRRDKPSIAVLPFTNMSGDPEQEYFADGISEDIITACRSCPQLFVIARNSSFTFKGKAVDVRQVGREARRALSCSKAASAKPATGCASPPS